MCGMGLGFGAGCDLRVRQPVDVDRPRKTKKPPILRKEAIFRGTNAYGANGIT